MPYGRWPAYAGQRVAVEAYSVTKSTRPRRVAATGRARVRKVKIIPGGDQHDRRQYIHEAAERTTVARHHRRVIEPASRPSTDGLSQPLRGARIAASVNSASAAMKLIAPGRYSTDQTMSEEIPSTPDQGG